MIWLCEFRNDINGWDLKKLYRDLKSWKKMIEKKNEIVCKIKNWMVLNNMEWNCLDGLPKHEIKVFLFSASNALVR